MAERPLDRVIYHTNRSGKLPLELHLDDVGCTQDDASIVQDIVLVAGARIQSLDFTMTSPEILHFHRLVFEHILSGISPSDFKTLRISCEVSLPDAFITGYDSGPWLAFETGNAPHSDLGPNILRWKQGIINSGFSGVTNLHLQGVFFNWSSTLYHGLVDLRLTAPPIGKATDIHISTLKYILSKCPGLRTFQFSLHLITNEVDDEPSLQRPSDPVSLPDLEMIRVSTAHAYIGGRPSFYVGSLLRLFAPGSKPLRLILETGRNPNEPLFESNGMKEFLVRSKVERLCIRNGHPSINEMRLCHLPDLKHLAFDSCHRISAPTSPNWSLGLQSLFVNATTLGQEDVRSMVELCPNGLTLSMCKICPTHVDEKQAQSVPELDLQAMFPAVRFTMNERLWCNLIARWSNLD
ncbi:hypothetical protein RSOLAG1IB_10506 [Rhizoctonia solani AG-1 IB]|uniref:F-box-like domain-containing protein n=1 Tax=Thanatephorus cucumeris (strain AG1-IB / isolate 7/3/14) TaxID=1108050 RepID=A0A0B7G2Z2_THACB|nr:hypothetical protein RSOLAG1IB_10506 [Rhizoctonia solani AG-1 IB]